MSDDALLAPSQQPPPPAVIPVAPTDLQHRTPLIDQAFSDGHLHQIRSTVAAHASSVIHDAQRIGIAVLIASELVINVVRHGGGHGWLRLWHVDNGLYLQITDQGPGMPDPTAGTVRPTPGQAHSRGMWIVRELADAVHIDTGPKGTSVTVFLQATVADRAGLPPTE